MRIDSRNGRGRRTDLVLRSGHLGRREPAPSAAALSWKRVDLPHSHQSLRGLDAVNAKVAWVSGDEGGVWRTTDGGKTWKDVRPDAEKALAFRDVEADSGDVAQVLSIGPRGQSRIYKTTDGGESWDLTFKNAESTAFYDCLAMFPDGMHGLAMSDPVDGKFRVIVDRRRRRHLEEGRRGGHAEGQGRRVRLRGQRHVRGHGRHQGRLDRVGRHRLAGLPLGRLRPHLDGRHDADPAGRRRRWRVLAGHAHRQRRHRRRRQLPRGGQRQADDGPYVGRRRHLDPRRQRGRLPLRRGWVPFSTTAVAVGPNGTDITTDGGRTWTPIGSTGFHSVQCVGTLSTTCWASGSDGHVGKLVGLPKG